MSQLTENRIFELIGSIYENANDPTPRGLQRTYLDIAEMFSCGPGGIILRNEEYDRFNLAVGDTPREFLREYEVHYQELNPFRKTLKNMRPGASFFRSNFMGDQEFAKSEFYNDCLRKIDIFEYASFPLVKSRGITAGLALTRPRSRPRFNSSERKALAILQPHLRNAMAVHMTFADAKNENRTIMSALTGMQQSVIVVDKDHKVRFASERAEKGLLVKDYLHIDSKGKLRACSPSDDKRLSKLLSGVFNLCADNIANHGGALQISRAGDPRALHVRVTPYLAHSFLGTGTEAMAMIFVHDPHTSRKTQESVLTQLFELTKAEAHLASILAEGKTIDEACGILGIAQNTAKTHLKHIFAKTNTHRQSELVKIVISGLANLRI